MRNMRLDSIGRAAKVLTLVVAVSGLAACASTGASVSRASTDDPFEAQNRAVHQFNLGVDRALVRPAGQAYVSAVPESVQDVVGNFASNLSVPGDVVNNVLQGDLESAATNTLRFLFNSTFGLAGLFDLATPAGLPDEGTNFGETLHVWGAGEGVYLELPLLGPSTTRDAVGLVVDIALNPVSRVLPAPEKHWGTGAKVADRIGDRGRYGATIDALLYESADSYAQTKLFYLQNRRFELNGEAPAAYLDDYDDPYDDPYLQ